MTCSVRSSISPSWRNGEVRSPVPLGALRREKKRFLGFWGIPENGHEINAKMTIWSFIHLYATNFWDDPIWGWKNLTERRSVFSSCSVVCRHARVYINFVPWEYTKSASPHTYVKILHFFEIYSNYIWLTVYSWLKIIHVYIVYSYIS